MSVAAVRLSTKAATVDLLLVGRGGVILLRLVTPREGHQAGGEQGQQRQEQQAHLRT
jgi:hypothetical protein